MTVQITVHLETEEDCLIKFTHVKPGSKKAIIQDLTHETKLFYANVYDETIEVGDFAPMFL